MHVRWAGCLLLVITSVTAGAAPATDDGKVRLVEDHTTDRVMSVTATLNIRGRLLTPVGTRQVVPLPLEGTAELKWHERQLAPTGEFHLGLRAVRRFLTARSRVRVDRQTTSQALRPARRTIVSEGTVEGLRAITIEDVKTFYKERYTSSNLKIGLAGDFPDGFAVRVREDFEQSLPKGEGRAKPLPEVPTRDKMDVLVVEKSTADSTAISLGIPLAITRADDDFYPLLLANIYLGDHRSFNGVLMNELRAKRGLNYGNYSYIENFIQEGESTFPVPNIPRRQQFFSIWIRPVAPENAHFALRGAVFYLRRLVEQGMTEKEFKAMKKYVLSHSKLWVQSLDRRLGYHLDSSYYQAPFYIDEIERHLDAMNLEDVNRAVKKHLDRWDFRVAMVAAKASPLAEAVESNARSPVVYQTEGTSKDVLAEDAKIEGLSLPIGSMRIVPVGEIFEK